MKLTNEQFESLRDKAADLNNTTVERLMRKGRGKLACVETRQMISAILHDNGEGWSEIATKLNRTHASIINAYGNHARDYASLNYYEQSFDRLRKFMAIEEDGLCDFDGKLISENERLRNENAQLKDKIFNIKQNSINLTKSLQTLCD